MLDWLREVSDVPMRRTNRRRIARGHLATADASRCWRDSEEDATCGWGVGSRCQKARDVCRRCWVCVAWWASLL